MKRKFSASADAAGCDVCGLSQDTAEPGPYPKRVAKILASRVYNARLASLVHEHRIDLSPTSDEPELPQRANRDPHRHPRMRFSRTTETDVR